MKKITVQLLCALTLFSSQSQAESLWDVAKPAIGQQASGDTVFSFTTPAAGHLIQQTYRFYTGSAACTGAFSVKNYTPCVDTAHANKTYFVTEANLYLISAAIPVTASNVKCLRQISFPSSLEGGAGTCNSGTRTCSSSSEPFPTQVLASQGAC